MKKQFKAESKQLLELMIHSIYSSKDIFLREIISNSSDALDKRHFYSLTDASNEYDQLEIEIRVDEEKRLVQIIDNGIGMDETDLENNLGTIASSGTKAFIESLENNEEGIETIGQFGVGFYSAFIVSDEVTVETKKAGCEAKLWSSDGIDTYSISDSDKQEIGTVITIKLREGSEYDQFCSSATITSLIKKYSNYIKYPIYMESANDGEVKREVINSQKAIWKKSKAEVTNEEYNEFYKSTYFDFQDPRFIMHVNVEGTQNFQFLGFVPNQNNSLFETIEKGSGLDLYSKGILIDKDVDYLINPAFNFIKGLVDSSDLNLNISREMLQRDESVTKLTKAINNRIKKELLRKLKSDRNEYNQFYAIYGNALTFGAYNNYGADRDLFEDLLQFELNTNSEFVTFKEYLAANEDAEHIYYATGSSREAILADPIMKQVTDKGIDVLLLTGDIDEFAIKILDAYNNVPFTSFEEIELATDEEKDEINKLTNENSELLVKMASAITNLKSVELATNLGEDACRIKSGGAISLEMERVLAKNPDGGNMPNEKILEINPNSPLFDKLKSLNEADLEETVKLIYNQQLIKEGLELEDSSGFIEAITKLIIKN